MSLNSEPIKILVVDDSALFRSQVKSALGDQPHIKVVGSAGNGQEALTFIGREPVDVLVMDVEMPVMDGIQTTKEISQRKLNCKVILFSGTTKSSAVKILDALHFGAADFLAKPSLEVSSAQTPAQRIREVLLPKINSLFGFAQKQNSGPVKRTYSQVIWETFRPSALVIASSTGGPAALEAFFKGIDFAFPCPVLIAQHMPPVFTASLAERLERVSGKACREAVDGEEPKADQIYIAPGNFHMELQSVAGRNQIRLHQEPLVNFVRPAADLLFKTAAQIYGRGLMGIVFTGMGHDGLEGCQAVKDRRGVVLIQNKETSVVFGMPGAVFEAGLYDYMGNIDELRRQVKMVCSPGGRSHVA